MQARLVIDWTQMPTYNTIMSVAAGSALMSIVQFVRALAAGREPGGVQTVVGFVWWLSGLGFFLFGALNFFTHIGLIVHTMPAG